jgi:tetratricopeptide (TPR) repeat protein
MNLPFNNRSLPSGICACLIVIAAMQPILSADAIGTVDQLFQTGLALLRKNRNAEARAVFLEASELEPKSASIHCNLGLSWENDGNMKNALEEFKRALELDRNMPEAMLNIAACYQSLGEIKRAIGWYRRFLKRNSSSVSAEEVRATISALAESLSLPDSNPQLSDYLGTIYAVNRARWMKSPIKIFVTPGETKSASEEQFQAICLKAAEQWAAATEHRIRFSGTNEKKSADIVVDRTDQPEKTGGIYSSSERGATVLDTKNNIITHAHITILILPMLENGTITDELIMKSCLHEFGHALGLSTHSTNVADIMSLTTDSPLLSPELSARDKATISKLYFQSTYP